MNRSESIASQSNLVIEDNSFQTNVKGDPSKAVPNPSFAKMKMSHI